MRILRDTPATVSVVFRSAGVDVPDPGEVAVEVVADDGSAVADGDASVAGSRATFPLTAEHTAELDLLTVTWTSDNAGVRRTRAEVVGGFLVEVGAVPGVDGVDPVDVEEVLAEVEGRIERACHRAFVPRYRRDTVHVARGHRVRLTRQANRLLRVWNADGPGDPDGWTLSPSGHLLAAPSQVKGRWQVAYEHGDPFPPADLVEAAEQAAATLLLERRSGRKPARATSMITEGSTINFASLPDLDRGRVFGMPDVDAVITSHAEPEVVLA